MRPVQQDRFYKPPEQRGNCVASCIASIFEVPLVSVDIPDAPSVSVIREWTLRNYPGLDYTEIDKCHNHRIIDQDDEGSIWRYDYPDEEPRQPHSGYWLAYCISPRVMTIHGPYKGMPGQHAVVMKANTLVYDPHPERDMGVGMRVGLGYWFCADPAKLA